MGQEWRKGWRQRGWEGRGVDSVMAWFLFKSAERKKFRIIFFDVFV